MNFFTRGGARKRRMRQRPWEHCETIRSDPRPSMGRYPALVPTRDPKRSSTGSEDSIDNFTWKRDLDSSPENHSPRSQTGRQAAASAPRHRPAEPTLQPPAKGTHPRKQGMGVEACGLTESSAWFAAENASMSSTVSRASTSSISSSRSSPFSVVCSGSDIGSVS